MDLRRLSFSFGVCVPNLGGHNYFQNRLKVSPPHTLSPPSYTDPEDHIHSNLKHAIKNCITPKLDLNAIVCYVDASSDKAKELKKFFPITILPATIRLKPNGQVKPGMQGQEMTSLSAHDLVSLLESTLDSYDNPVSINIKFQDGTHFIHSTTQAARLRDVYAAVDEYCRENKKAGFKKYLLVKPGQGHAGAGGGLGTASLDSKLVHLRYFSMNCSLIVQPTSTPGCYVSPNPYIPPPRPKKKNSVLGAAAAMEAGGGGLVSTSPSETHPASISISVQVTQLNGHRIHLQLPSTASVSDMLDKIDQETSNVAGGGGRYLLVSAGLPRRVLYSCDLGLNIYDEFGSRAAFKLEPLPIPSINNKGKEKLGIIKQQIQNNKGQGKEDVQQPSIADDENVSSSAVPVPPSGLITISIKLPDGTSLKANFSPDDTTLQQVRHHIDTHRQDTVHPEGVYRLVSGPFPKRELDAGDGNSEGSTLTLAELHIADRSTLIVEPVEWTRPREEKGGGGGWLGGWFGYLGGWGGQNIDGSSDIGGDTNDGKREEDKGDKNEYWNGNSTVFGGDDE